MIVEVVAVGTELLLGQIVNGNAAHIGARLAEQGFDALHQAVVGDNLDRMVDVLTTAMRRADAVIVTGGIGPTQDDITREAIAAATGRALLFSEEYEAELRRRFERAGRVMPENNLRQAEYPEGAEMLPNPKGSAPGLALDHEGTHLFALPGVPAEMHQLLADHVLPRLRTVAGVTDVIVSRLLRSWGMSESMVAERLADLYESATNPTMAFLASSGEIKVRLTAKAPSMTAARDLIIPVEREVRLRLGSHVFGADDDTIGAVIQRLLSERGWTIGTAESMTAGLVAAALTSEPGSSAVFVGGVIAYDADVKTSALGVDAELVARFGQVSPEVAMAMAEGARDRLGCDVGVSVTGSAGPDPLDSPVGTSWIGVATPEDSRARMLQMPGDRERVRTYTTTATLHLARLGISGAWWH